MVKQKRHGMCGICFTCGKNIIWLKDKISRKAKSIPVEPDSFKMEILFDPKKHVVHECGECKPESS